MTEKWNKDHPDNKPRKAFKFSKTDSKAFIAAFLYMGLTDKVEWKNYWSNDDNENDSFVKQLKLYSGLSARRFRKILNAIRLYDKQLASEQGLTDRKKETYDEHHKVMVLIIFIYTN